MSRTKNIKLLSLESLVVLFTLAIAVLVTTVTVLAYGPERQTYTIEKPADKITFNSITNSQYGDERNFTLIRPAERTGTGGWSDEATVTDGQEYTVRVFVHNNAAANLNLVATNTRVSVLVPTTTGNSVTIAANVLADNATPQKVWDEVVLKSDKRFNIAYVPGSAIYYNNKFVNGTPLPDSIVTAAGAKVGYAAMDGNVQGCYEYSGVATFKVKIQGEAVPNFTVNKEVRLSGTTEWKKSVTAKPGQKVDYIISYANTGKVWQNNVVVKDVLPKNVSYVNSTTMLKNASNPSGDGVKVSDGLTTGKGINIGNYASPANAYVRFSATMPANDKLELCGTNKLINTATIETEHGKKSSTAEVVIDKENCGPRECKPGIPLGDKRCDDSVAALPQTGPAEIIGAIVGVTALTAAFIYWLHSRNRIAKVMNGEASIDQTAVDTPSENVVTHDK